MNAIHRRLESLDARPSWFLARLLLVAGSSWALSAAELVLYAFSRRIMVRGLTRSSAQSVRLALHVLRPFGYGLLFGAAIGAPLLGRIADVKGRRYALLLAKTLSLLGVALSVLVSRDYELIVARLLAGIGLGGELPVATVLLYELAPKPMRARMVALLYAFAGVGGVVGLALVSLLEPQFGWRSPYAVLCVAMLYVGVLCFRFPKSPRWLASAGREAEAVAAVENLERAQVSRVNYDRVSEEGLPETEETSVSVETEALVESGKSSSSSSVRDKPLGAATARLWTLWAVMELSGYALGKYVPILISLWGFNMFSRWTTAVLLGLVQVSGSVLASMKLEEVGLKKLLVCCAAPAALVAVVLSYAPWNGPVVVVGTCAVSALLAAAWSCVLVSAPSNFSTEVRGRGVGYAFGFSRLATVIGSWLYPRMFNLWRMSAPAIAWAFAVLLVLAVLWFTLPFEPARSSMQSKYIVELTDVNTRDKVNQDEDEEDLPPVVTHSKSHKDE
ncbi:uncharacterized protein IUM83_17352 [Phytophthora cinnamomi]|uniref:uncharacterized protein n=1 Tax=Phytophthora cinnamomi TaxID=4785 RepID=UPI00355A759F|nr:hypothetical protein IUM83_17352 [Phytophthora cinnamomi]